MAVRRCHQPVIRVRVTSAAGTYRPAAASVVKAVGQDVFLVVERRSERFRGVPRDTRSRTALVPRKTLVVRQVQPTGVSNARRNRNRSTPDGDIQ